MLFHYWFSHSPPPPKKKREGGGQDGKPPNPNPFWCYGSFVWVSCQSMILLLMMKEDNFPDLSTALVLFSIKVFPETYFLPPTRTCPQYVMVHVQERDPAKIPRDTCEHVPNLFDKLWYKPSINHCCAFTLKYQEMRVNMSSRKLVI